MAKQKFKITNWPTYNKALINRGSITFWLDDEAIQAWYESATPSSRGRPQRYSDLAITTVLVIKRVFRLTLRAAQGFIDSIFSLMNVPLRCPDYSCVSRRAKSVNISFKTPTRGEIAHLVIDSTGLKVFGTTLNQMYLERGDLQVELLGRGFAWLDTGTHDSLIEASQFIHTIEKRQGMKVACLEEIAYRNQWLSAEGVAAQAERLKKTEYGAYLKRLLSED
nr:IS5 family transposase [Klebsiella pneumoniae]